MASKPQKANKSSVPQMAVSKQVCGQSLVSYCMKQNEAKKFSLILSWVYIHHLKQQS